MIMERIKLKVVYADLEEELTIGLAGIGQSDCSKIGGDNIFDASQCKRAAKKIGKLFFSSWPWDEPDYPKGCYLYTGIMGMVYLNEISFGQSNPKANPVCKLKGKPTVTIR